MMRSGWIHSTQLCDFLDFHDPLLLRLRNSGVPASFLRFVADESHYISTYNQNTTKSIVARGSIGTIWHSFEYHPMWTCLGSMLRCFCDDEFNRFLFKQVFGNETVLDIRAAWRLSQRPFGGLLIEW